MSNKHDIFDDLIKSQLEGFEANVSMADWDAIEAQLPVTKRNKVAAYWWVTGLVLLVVGSLATIVWKNFNQSSQVPNAVAVIDDAQTIKEESVVKNNNIPTPTEAPTEKTVNEPNQPENLNTEITTTTSSGVDTKTSVQSTTGPDKLPTNIVDIKPKGFHIKGVENLGFSTEFNMVALSNVTYPADQLAEAGNKETPNTFVPKWEVGITLSPTWANKLISPNGGNAWRINKDYTNISKTMESGSTSYQFEARVNRYLKENIYLNAGLNYNQIVEKVNYDYTVTEFVTERPDFKDLIYTKFHPQIGSIDVKYSGTNTYQYFELPVRIGYIQPIPQTKAKIRVETGLRYMFLADMSGKRTDVTHIVSLNDLSTSLNDYSRHNLGATANAGIYWGLKNNTDFGVTANYNYALTSIRKRDEGITEKPFNFGLNFSIQHKILIK